METKGQVRQQIIAQVTSAYTRAVEAARDDGEPAATYDEPEPARWSIDNLAEAYADVVIMFASYGMEMERRHGESFLAFLQERALDYTEDDPPAGRIRWDP